MARRCDIIPFDCSPAKFGYFPIHRGVRIHSVSLRLDERGADSFPLVRQKRHFLRSRPIPSCARAGDLLASEALPKMAYLCHWAREAGIAAHHTLPKSKLEHDPRVRYCARISTSRSWVDWTLKVA